jgi:hypothetical protein
MPIKISDDFMCVEIDGKTIATATQRADNWWDVSYWPTAAGVLPEHLYHLAPITGHDAPPAPSLEQTVRAWHAADHSQHAIARELNIDRRKVKRILGQAAYPNP